MNYKNIKIEKRENYAIIEIANKKKNSLDNKTLTEISNATTNLNKDKKIKCIGLIGNSKFFSPGADINELKTLNSVRAKRIKLFSKMDSFQKIDIPVISFVEGYALGGGFELALSTDIIIASDKANFGLPEINLGLIPGIGGTQNTKRLALTGDIINSAKAMSMGIVSEIVPSEIFKSFTIRFLENISSKPRNTLIIIKKLINKSETYQTAIQQERKEFYKLLDGKNKKIGIESFLNKSKPRWK